MSDNTADTIITGTFRYNITTRSLIFDFDPEFAEYTSDIRPYGLTVEPRQEKAMGVWHDTNGNPIPCIPAVYLTLAPQAEYKGLVVDIKPSEAINRPSRQQSL